VRRPLQAGGGAVKDKMNGHRSFRPSIPARVL
jgi:hypothetical protein